MRLCVAIAAEVFNFTQSPQANLGCAIFTAIAGTEWKKLRATVLEPGKLTSETITLRSNMITKSEISHLSPMAANLFSGLKKEFDTLSTSLNTSTGISLGQAGKKITRRKLF